MTGIVEAAGILDAAAHPGHAVGQFAPGTSTLEQAYEIQRASMDRRLRRGARIRGVKLGFTRRARMVQMGLDSLIRGLLTDAMIEEEGGDVDLGRYVHPRAEPEVCRVSRRVISGPLTALEAVDCLEAVAPAMEIIGSRFANFKLDPVNVVAEHCSSSGRVGGQWQDGAGQRLFQHG